MLDAIIIGAGPIGLACGIELKKRGLSYLIIEKGVLVNSMYHYPENMTFFSTSDKLEIGEVPFVSHNPKPTRQEALEYYRRGAEKDALSINLYEEIEGIVTPIFSPVQYCLQVPPGPTGHGGGRTPWRLSQTHSGNRYGGIQGDSKGSSAPHPRPSVCQRGSDRWHRGVSGGFGRARGVPE